MKKNVLFLALDVDDKAFHGCGYCKSSDTYFEFATRPIVSKLEKKLRELVAKGYELKLCYEACHLGYSLCRDLIDRGWDCSIIAPSSIPRKNGNVVKTDRVDAKKLSQFYANGLLTVIRIPEKSEESFKNFIRSRKFLIKQSSALKKHIVSLCRLEGLNYKLDQNSRSANHFTQRHMHWLSAQALNSENVFFRENLRSLLSCLRQIQGNIEYYDQKIRESVESNAVLKERVDSLRCYRGIDTLIAATIVLELGDIKRFKHPRGLVSFIGLDICEYSMRSA